MFKILQVDCCSDAMLLLNKEMVIPTFSLPDLTGTNPFDRMASSSIDMPVYANIGI